MKTQQLLDKYAQNESWGRVKDVDVVSTKSTYSESGYWVPKGLDFRIARTLLISRITRRTEFEPKIF